MSFNCHHFSTKQFEKQEVAWKNRSLMRSHDRIGNKYPRYLFATEPSTVQTLYSFLGGVNCVKLDVDLALQLRSIGGARTKYARGCRPVFPFRL